MKKSILFTLLALMLLLSSCRRDGGFFANDEKNHVIVEIDGCEYIRFDRVVTGNNGYALGHFTHKGNCKNPIHCYKE